METTKSKLKGKLFQLIPKKYKKFLEQEILGEHNYYKFMNICFSQEGEDQILSQYFYGINNGFYVDIGANHAIKYSNTYKFYLNGWRGINIDAMPGSMESFKHMRPEDTNIEVGISEEIGYLKFYIFNDSKVNTFSEDSAKEMIKNGYIHLRTVEVRTDRLQNVLQQYLPLNKPVEFLSLDVEGLELEVLKSNNWEKFRPKVVLVESLKLKNKVILSEFLSQVGYKFLAQTVNNLYFVDKTNDFEYLD